MKTLMFILLFIFDINVIKIHAITKIIYYCEIKQTANSKYFTIGYFDRPCDVLVAGEKFIKQKILSLEYYQKNYKIYDYEQQYACSKINDQIRQLAGLLMINKNNKAVTNKLKRKLVRCKQLKRKTCSLIY